MAPAGGFTPRQAEDYLRSLERFGMRFGLERMHRLTTALGMPQLRFASIHVVGTNGKSSVARMTAAILEHCGQRTGCYTSPHISGFAERLEIGEQAVSAEQMAAALWRASEAAKLVDRTLPEGDHVTQFEALTGAAFSELALQRVQVAVIEAGLGGRFDATNVLTSRVQVLTSVGLDHTQLLGSTEAEIAAEKLAVVPVHGRLVCGELGPEALAAAEATAAERHAELLLAARDFATEAEVALPGRFQRRNFAVAAAAAKVFLGEQLQPGLLASAAAGLRLPGRVEVVGASPPVVLDGAHNPDGMQALVEALPEVVGERPLVALVAVLDDKDAAGILELLLPHCRHCVFTRSSDPRCLPPAALLRLAEQLSGPTAEVVAEPRAGLERAQELAGADGAVLVTGSITLLADLAADDVRSAARIG